MINLVFTLVSAILGVAMFGAILLAPAKSQAEASIASNKSAGDGSSSAIVSVTKHRAFDALAIDEIRVANINVNSGSQQNPAPQPPRPATDQGPRTQVAQIAKTQTWQMAAQIPDTRNSFRQM